MEHKAYNLFLATPESIVYEGAANFLIAPGTLGYFEILFDHAPMIASLQRGKLEFLDRDQKKWNLVISGGILEVDHNQVSVLADAVENTD